MTISLILLAGGSGSRMKSSIPKQFLPYNNKPLVLHSLDIFLQHPAIKQHIVVCDSKFQNYFSGYDVQFAAPGTRRQDSVYSGLQMAFCDWICVHDAARPNISLDMISNLIESGKKIGAAALGMPLKYTIKQSDGDGFVHSSLDRNLLWEMQTPQLLSKKILEDGFAYINERGITVTDDVMIAELIGHRVKLVEGSYKNIKITTPEDLVICQNINV